MTNTQQPVIDQVCGAEQSQEEIQLTELLPVEQSRIENTSDNRDNTTTDGLKVLRSFSQNNQSEFDPRNFKFFEKSQDCEFPSRKNSFKINGQQNIKRKQVVYLHNNDNDDEHTDEEDSDIDGVNDDIDIDSNSDHIEDDDEGTSNFDGLLEIECNNSILKTKRKKYSKRKLNLPWNNTENSENQNDEFFTQEKIKKSRARTSKKKKTYQKDILKDGIFYYQQEEKNSHDDINKNSSDEDKLLGDNISENINNQFCNGNSTFKSNTKSHRTAKKSKTLQHDYSIKNSNNNQKELSAEQRESENDLKHKIGVIIESNYILEQENNNIVQHDNNSDSLESSSNETSTGTNNCSKISEGDDQPKDDQQIKKYCCLMCDAKFKGSGGLRNHWKVVHAAGPFFKCDDCGKEFPLKERLKLHVRTHTGFKPYKCSECDKSFARGGQLAQHRRTHSHIKPYHCALCTGTFTCAANLALHMKRHNGQKDHKCDICGRGFIRRDALKKHLECLHKDVKSFLCIICNKTFKGHLPQHMRTHCQDRPHGCATCGQRFAQKSQLTVHQRTHSGQRPFRCLVCWQAFAHSTALKLHTRRHTGERPFKCSECNAGFTQLPHWKKHMKCIHGRNEPYNCKNCNLFFRIKSDLENHERNCLKTSEIADKSGDELAKETGKYCVMSIEKMRLLLAVLLKRISKPEKLDELGFGKRLIDQVLQDSLISAGKDPARVGELTEFEALRKNLETFLEWTVPKEHWETFKKMNKSPEEILETLTTT
ncbi:zinc finger protein 250-like [Chelonus insularis]|uniref:zinc finger protein 250-like n=1 Tax=Chelonus insularis TaxID=460826 RepID=UPI00158C89A1|nr:zinc finger protein 250-like [Chelonus insularis]